MIVQVIGYYCLVSATMGSIAIAASIIQKDTVPEGSRIKVQFLIVAELALAVWCFK